MILGQFTDLHIRAPGERAYRHVDTAACLTRAIRQLNAEPVSVDMLLLTGDLTDWGTDAEYAHLAALLSEIRCPYRLMPGNHDNRAALRRAFPDHDYLGTGGPISYSFDLGPIRIIALDTTVPGEAKGKIGAIQCQWLMRELDAARDLPVVIAMHHPPFATGIEHMDAIGLTDADTFRSVIAAYPQIRRIICGHIHRSISTSFAGTTASVAPSIAHQLTLGLEPEAPASFTDEPGGYQLHWLSPRNKIVSHTVQIGDWDGPYPIFNEGALIR